MGGLQATSLENAVILGVCLLPSDNGAYMAGWGMAWSWVRHGLVMGGALPGHGWGTAWSWVGHDLVMVGAQSCNGWNWLEMGVCPTAGYHRASYYYYYYYYYY